MKLSFVVNVFVNTIRGWYAVLENCSICFWIWATKSSLTGRICWSLILRLSMDISTWPVETVSNKWTLLYLKKQILEEILTKYMYQVTFEACEYFKGLLKSILKNCWNFFILILTIKLIRNCVSFCIFVLSFATKRKQSFMLAPPPKIPPSQALPDVLYVTSHAKNRGAPVKEEFLRAGLTWNSVSAL